MEKKENILITGAGRQIGRETVHELLQLGTGHHLVLGDYNPGQLKKELCSGPIGAKSWQDIEFRKLDFADPARFIDATRNIGVVFLNQPPHLMDVDDYYKPFFNAMKINGVRKIVYLSAQGIEKQFIKPQHKMEKLIRDHGLEYVFLQPGFFMQNITTSFLPDIVNRERIFMPCGKRKFNWVDVGDIARVAARVLNHFELYKGRSLEITGSDYKGFHEVADILSEQLNRPITYDSPNLFRFIKEKSENGISKAMISMMMISQLVPSFEKSKNRITGTVERVTGEKPVSLKEFIIREKHLFN